jgi:hypothetical protein
MQATLIVLAVGVFAALLINCLIVKPLIHPPIAPQEFVDDDEYCRLMPEIPRDTALRVREGLVDATGWDREEIHPQTKLIEFEYW